MKPSPPPKSIGKAAHMPSPSKSLQQTKNPLTNVSMSSIQAAGQSTSSQGTAVLTLANMVHLVEDPTTRDQYERHAAELTALLQAEPKKGFSVRDALEGIPRLMRHLTEAVQQHPAALEILRAPLQALLEHCGRPLEARTLNDQRGRVQAIVEVFDSVSTALYVPHSAVRCTAATVLKEMMERIRRERGDDVAPTSASRKEPLVIRPSTLEALVGAWKKALFAADVENESEKKRQRDVAAAAVDEEDEEDGPVTVTTQRSPAADAAATELLLYLKASIQFSYFSTCCQQLTDLGVVESLCRTAALCAAGDRRIALSIELLWNLLSLCPHTAATCASTAVLPPLYNVFLSVLSLGYKRSERELRNDMIVLHTLVADCDDSLPLLIPFAELALDLSCGAERVDGEPNPHINPRFHHTVQHEELQMKLLAWKLLEKLCLKNQVFGQAVFEWGFVDVLLSYVNVRCEHPAVVRWSTEQLLEIQRAVLNILLLLAPVSGTYYVEGNATGILLEYIQECPDLPLRNLAVGTLAAIARTPLRSTLADHGAIALILALLSEDQQDNTLRVDCLSVLADVVDRDPQLQEEFLRCGGIHAILPLMSFAPDYYTDLKDAIVFGAVDCVWSCIAGSPSCEELFVQEDGIHLLLSILETCPSSISVFPLTCLADLMDGQDAIAEFRAWRSERSQRSAMQLLLSLWSLSGDSDGMVVSVNDIKAQFDASSTSEQQHDTSVKQSLPIGLRSIGCSSTLKKATVGGGASITSTAHNASLTSAVEQLEGASNDVDDDEVLVSRQGLVPPPEDIEPIVSENETKFKVYCVLRSVGFDDHKELSALERTVLAAVQVFAELCKDEVWSSISESLAQDQLEPVTADAEKLRKVRDVALARCAELSSTRQTLKHAHSRQQEDDEATFYKTLVKKTDEKVVAKKGATLSITEAKIRKAQMLKASFKQAMAKQAQQKMGSSAALNNLSSGGPNNSNSNSSAAPQSSAQPAGGATPSTSTPEPRKSLVPLFASKDAERWGMGQRAMSDEEFALLQALNKVRTDPLSLIPHLKERIGYISNDGTSIAVPGRDVETAVEGAAPYLELIEMLEAMRPMVTMLDVPMGMLLAARDHVSDLGRRMEATQDGADGSTPQVRMNRYGRVGVKSAQLLSLAKKDPLEIVIQLAVDDGISTRIDRKALFDPDVRVVGVAVGPHSIHEHVAVLVLAHEYTDKPPNEQRDVYMRLNGNPLKTNQAKK